MLNKRILYTQLFLLLITLYMPLNTVAQRDTVDFPNIILIIADDIGSNDIGLYGNHDVKTPNIDRLGSRGLVFDNMYVTTSSCSPSRSSIISGRYPHNTGAPELHDPLPAEQFMFPEILRKKGYYTVLSGKNHMGPAVKKCFDQVSSGDGPGAEADWVPILQERPKDKPFFLWFAAHDAHRAWQFNAYGATYDPETLQVPPMLYDGPETRKDIAGYYHEISRLDHYVGEIIKELQRQDILENTYIIFMSDNGSPFPRNKARLYDSGVKTPFVVVGPNIPNARTNALFSSIDIAPSILRMAGEQSKDQRIQGQSFFCVLQGQDSIVRDFVFTEHNWHVFQAYERMVRYKDWVYIRNGFPKRQNLASESSKMFPAGQELWDAYEKGLLHDHQKDIFLSPRPTEELYNVSKDPFQFDNVVDAVNNQEIRLYLSHVLDRWIAETGDSKPEDPTPDRDDLNGKQLSEKWRKREKPGERNRADTLNHPGPIFEKDIKMNSPNVIPTTSWR